MSVIFVALPASIALAAFGLIAFIWMVRTGQMDDVDTPAVRMLLDDDEPGGSAAGKVGPDAVESSAPTRTDTSC